MSYPYEFICSAYNQSKDKVVLWRRGNYLYEIEFGAGLDKTTKLFECEFYDAERMFQNVCKLATWQAREMMK